MSEIYVYIFLFFYQKYNPNMAYFKHFKSYKLRESKYYILIKILTLNNI